jgi:hypothetical protein
MKRQSYFDWLLSEIAHIRWMRRWHQKRRYDAERAANGKKRAYMACYIASGRHTAVCRAYRARKKAYLEALFGDVR